MVHPVVEHDRMKGTVYAQQILAHEYADILQHLRLAGTVTYKQNELAAARGQFSSQRPYL